jgi:hypothetical protein
MSENEQEPETGNESTSGSNDEQDDPFTPDDLKPGEDNPLAEPLDDDEAREDLDVLGGKTPEDGDDDDRGAQEETGSEEE